MKTPRNHRGEEGAINLYTCKNHHRIIVMHRDSGATAMVIGCDKCEAQAFSHCYNPKDKILVGEATHQWYRPTDEEWSDLKADLGGDQSRQLIKDLKKNVKKGWLIIRPFPEPEQQLKSIEFLTNYNQ